MKIKKLLRAKKAGAEVARLFDIPTEALLNLPTMQLFGNKKLTLDGIRGIAAYDEGRILLTARHMSVEICGSELDILYIDDKSIVLRGEIGSVSFTNPVKGGRTHVAE